MVFRPLTMTKKILNAFFLMTWSRVYNGPKPQFVAKFERAYICKLLKQLYVCVCVYVCVEWVLNFDY